MNNLKKYWILYAVLMAVIGAIGWIFTQGGISVEKESRLFTTPEKRIETESYMDQQPSPAQNMRAYILDSVEKTHRIKSRNKRDSLYKLEVELRLEEAKARKRTDSIVILNADQMYQIKDEIRQLKEQ